MTAQIHTFPDLKSQADLDYESLYGDYSDAVKLAACERLKQHPSPHYQQTARYVEAAIIATMIARRAGSWLRNIALALGVTLIGAGIGASLVKSYQNFWVVTEWSQTQ